MNKFIAVIAAVMMIVAIPIGFVASDADADTGVTGTYSVYAYDGDAWSSDVVGAYSPLACAGEPFGDNTISLIYEEVEM